MKKFNKKSLALLIAAALLLTITVSGTVAYLVDSTGEVKNVFEPGSVIPSITEDTTTTPGVKKDVQITNSGNVNAYIRAMVVVTWQDANGNVYPEMPGSDDYTIDYNDSDWESVGNYWYYKYVVAANGGKTKALINSCEPVDANVPENYYLHVEILAQAIQAEPTDVVTKVWGWTPPTTDN